MVLREASMSGKDLEGDDFEQRPKEDGVNRIHSFKSYFFVVNPVRVFFH